MVVPACNSGAVTPAGRRYGITVPFDGVPLHDHRRWLEELASLGYTDAWSAEVDGADGFTPLALAAAWTPGLHLGVAVAPAFTRGPALLAQTAAAMAEAAPGRFTLGLGASSPVIVERWNGIPYADPYHRVRDTLRVPARRAGRREGDRRLRDVLGARGSGCRGRWSSRRRSTWPPCDRACCAWPGGRRTAWSSTGWPPRTCPPPWPRWGRARRWWPASSWCPWTTPATARAVGRRMITAYLTVPAYAAFHRWLGRGAALEAMWEAWDAGDRRAALAAVPDEVVDALVVHGSPEACRRHVEGYVANGVTVPVLQVVPAGVDLAEAVRGLAPAG